MTNSTAIKGFRVTASYTDRNGVEVSCDTSKVLGDEGRKRYTSRGDAEAAADELQSSAAGYGLDPSTKYSVVDAEWADEPEYA